MNADSMVDWDPLLKREVRPAYWIVEDEVCLQNDAMVFTALNLSKAEQAIEEMDAVDHRDRPETICVEDGAADQITPDLLEKIILEEDQVDWFDDLNEQIEQNWSGKKEKYQE